MEERKMTTSIKLNRLTKFRLEHKKDHDESYDHYVSAMLNFFDDTEIDPKKNYKNPYLLTERRFDRMEKILKKDIKDLFQPTIDFIQSGNVVEQNKEMLVKVANDNSDLRVKVKMLENDIVNLKNQVRVMEGELLNAQNETARVSDSYEAKMFGILTLLRTECSPSRFSRNLIGADLRVPESFFNDLIAKVGKEMEV